MAQTKQRRQVVAYENAMCHTCVHVHTCIHRCTCARTRVPMNNEISPFLLFFLSHYIHTAYIPLTFSFIFVMWDYVSAFICTGDVAACGVFDCAN